MKRKSIYTTIAILPCLLFTITGNIQLFFHSTGVRFHLLSSHAASGIHTETRDFPLIYRTAISYLANKVFTTIQLPK